MIYKFNVTNSVYEKVKTFIRTETTTIRFTMNPIKNSTGYYISVSIGDLLEHEKLIIFMQEDDMKLTPIEEPKGIFTRLLNKLGIR
jgi:hypothetical protein